MPAFEYSTTEISPERIADDLGLQIKRESYYLNDRHIDCVTHGIFFILDGEEELLQAARKLKYFTEKELPALP